MRLIDADELLKGKEDHQMISTHLIWNAPTADALPVVRCKDCRWWDKSEDSPFGYCMAMKHGYMSANWEIGIYRRYKGDFYCADGEREENEQTTIENESIG